MTRQSSSLSKGMRPVRELFREEHGGANTWWFCKLCAYSYYETPPDSGWPISITGLYALVKHLRGHTSS